MTTNGDMAPRRPDDAGPPEHLFGDDIDRVDKTVARITDAEVIEHLRRVLNRAGYSTNQALAALTIGTRTSAYRLASDLAHAPGLASAGEGAIASALERVPAIASGLDLISTLDQARVRARDHTVKFPRARKVGSYAALAALYLGNRTHARDLTSAIARARDRGRALDLILDQAIDRAHALTRALEGVGVLEQAHAHARALDRAIDRAHDRAIDRAHALDRAIDRAGADARDLYAALTDDTVDLDGALTRTQALDGVLTRALDLSRDLARDRDLDRILDLGRDLVDTLMVQEVDASGVDLSDVEIDQLEPLDGTIWTDQTTWPDNIKNQVIEHSRDVGPGVYQVIQGNEPVGEVLGDPLGPGGLGGPSGVGGRDGGEPVGFHAAKPASEQLSGESLSPRVQLLAHDRRRAEPVRVRDEERLGDLLAGAR